MDGVIVINKPADFTSFDVVAVMRGVAKTKKVGHTGTLDPMATGVLPLLFGSATKAQSLLPDSTKEYEAEFKLGLTTDTLDVWGTVQSEKPVNVTQQDIQNILPEFTGDILQLPPMYSAVQQDGKRLYELARQGIVVQREKRQVNVSLLQLLEFNENTHTGKLRIACSKGTYIRTLIDDIGARLNCGGIMTSLCRTKACGYTLNDAVTLEQAKQLGNEGALDSVLKDISLLFNVYRQVNVSLPQAKRFCNGGQLDLSRLRISNLQDAEVLRVYTYEGKFIGLGKVEQEKNWLAIYKLFNFI
ncbi:tRNA pseudouridine(55) synthase TruB [Oscillospiraceae bacterium LCP25S3_E10]|nr:tRNA pseudouridine(55) synthase TruB [Ruminococcus sp.]MDD6446642.1 tRNA pseudouridine(55) synthase TruB [Ruminococcus sp.]MDY2856131.1 tRNA pseudouridine(55) synthase TruB [Oscillospiraceae bacterium]